MRRVLFLVICWGVLVSSANADLIRGINIDFVTIGNPGNPGDMRTDFPNSAYPLGCGSVDYVYQIGKYEISNAQWYDFVSAAGEPTGNPSTAYDSPAYYTGDNIPANRVSWYEAAQFCNYLTSGNKTQGAYQFSGNEANPGWFESIDRDSAISTYGTVYVIPTEDEWYKAAYYGPVGRGGAYGYSTYANGADTAPIAGVDANYGNTVGDPWDVGNGTQEQNGTYDMMGNVAELTETAYGSTDYMFRGGWYHDGDTRLSSSYRTDIGQAHETYILGLRVASIPEPTTILLLGVGGLAVLRKKR